MAIIEVAQSLLPFLCGGSCLLSQYDQINRKKDDRCQCGKKNILIRYEGFRSVVVHDLVRARQNHHADIRTDHARNEDLRENAHALKLSRFADGCQIAYFRAEDRHAREISAHHQKRTDENGYRGAEEEENDIADGKPNEADDNREGEALAVVNLTPKHGDDGSKHDGGCHDEHVIGHTERYLVVENEVGHKDLNGNIKNDEREEIDVQRNVLFDRGRKKAVHDSGEIAVLLRFHLRLVDDEKADDANGDDDNTDDGENIGPAGGEIKIKRHEASEHRKDRNERHHRVNALGGASVGVVRAVRQPSVEGGIVCA